ncbi:hypothetical protein Bbelb_066950 [Branchiostoma belcheri]|nr:hypothetical protein Bbelb_066950 [Branchiostoma belcheri]
MASHGAWKGRTSWVKIPPRKTRHVRFGAASADSEGPEEDQTSVDTADHPAMEQLPQELFGCNFRELAAIDEDLSTCHKEGRDWEKDASTLLGELQDKDEGECSRPEHTADDMLSWVDWSKWQLAAKDYFKLMDADHVPVFAVGPVCVPVSYPVYLVYSRRICLCVSLRGLLAIYKTREHRTLTVNADPETGLQQEEEPDFYRQGCVKEDGEE